MLLYVEFGSNIGCDSIHRCRWRWKSEVTRCRRQAMRSSDRTGQSHSSTVEPPEGDIP